MDWRNEAMNAQKTIGIIGGMGPLATAVLFNEIIKATPARSDQDHVRVIIDCNPQIPDRTAAILGKGPSPVKALIQTAQRLESMGSVVLGMPCITAHYYHRVIQRSVAIPIVNILLLIQRQITDAFASIHRIGVIATTGSCKTGLFDAYLGKTYRLIYPSARIQRDIMEAIYGEQGIKSGIKGRKPRQLLIHAASALSKQGAEIIVAGCTEVPIVLRPSDLNIPLIDPLRILAKDLLERVKPIQ